MKILSYIRHMSRCASSFLQSIVFHLHIDLKSNIYNTTPIHSLTYKLVDKIRTAHFQDRICCFLRQNVLGVTMQQTIYLNNQNASSFVPKNYNKMFHLTTFVSFLSSPSSHLHFLCHGTHFFEYYSPKIIRYNNKIKNIQFKIYSKNVFQINIRCPTYNYHLKKIAFQFNK